MTEFDPTGLASTLLTLTVGTLIGTEFSRYYYRPKVIVKYKEIDPSFDKNGVYWSLQIENLGRTVAKNCLAHITLSGVKAEDVLEVKDASSEENLPQYDNEEIDLSLPRHQIISASHFRELRRTSLCWSKLGNPENLDINPGVSQSLDICKFHEQDNGGYFIFPSEVGWRHVRVRLKKKEIKGYVLICPANESPTRVDIVLKVSAAGKSEIEVKLPSFWSRLRRKRYI